MEQTDGVAGERVDVAAMHLWPAHRSAKPDDGQFKRSWMVRLEEITAIRAPIERCFDLARSVEMHLAGNVGSNEEAEATGGVTSGLIGLGQRVTWRARHFGIWQRLTSEITAMESPTYFRDTMVRGVFQFMKHDHFFRSLSPGETEMRDLFCFAAPLGTLGRLAEFIVLRRYMCAILRERNTMMRKIAESSEWQRYLPSTLGEDLKGSGRR